jgi:hypothetical protein
MDPDAQRVLGVVAALGSPKHRAPMQHTNSFHLLEAVRKAVFHGFWKGTKRLSVNSAAPTPYGIVLMDHGHRDELFSLVLDLDRSLISVFFRSFQDKRR